MVNTKPFPQSTCYICCNTQVRHVSKTPHIVYKTIYLIYTKISLR